MFLMHFLNFIYRIHNKLKNLEEYSQNVIDSTKWVIDTRNLIRVILIVILVQLLRSNCEIINNHNVTATKNTGSMNFYLWQKLTYFTGYYGVLSRYLANVECEFLIRNKIKILDMHYYSTVYTVTDYKHNNSTN